MSGYEPIFVGFYGPRGNRSSYKAVVCLLLHHLTGDVVGRGIAICDPRDVFNKGKGRLIAFGCAEEAHFRRGKPILREREHARIDAAEVLNGLFEAGFYVDVAKQDGEKAPCLPTLLKIDPFPEVFTNREQVAIDAWRRRNGFLEEEVAVGLKEHTA